MSEKLHINITANANNAIKQIDNVNKKIEITAKSIANLDKQKLENINIKTNTDDVNKSLEETKANFISQLEELETYKNLGLQVSTQLKERWQTYLLWLSENYKKDSLEYKNALSMKKQAEDIWYEESKKKVINYSKLSKASYNSITAGFNEMFTSVLKIESKSNNLLEKGFVAMANTFIKEVSRMASKWMAFQALKAAFTPLGILGFANGGNVKTFAGGGFVTGSGTATSDSIPAFLSNGEFVVNAKSASNNLDVLSEINGSSNLNGNSISNKLNQLINAVENLTNRPVNVFVNPDNIVKNASPQLVYKKAETGNNLLQRW